MRDYGKVAPSFWIGKTGKQLRGNPDAQLVALYLMTSPHSSMTGVFYCPIIYISNETGIPLEGASKALGSLQEADFCVYDPDTETVFVREMAKFQVEQQLKATDNRVKGIIKDFQSMPKGLIQQAFFDRYADAFHLPGDRLDCDEIEAPSKPLRSQEQEQEQNNKILSEPIADALVLTDPAQGKPESSKRGDDVEQAAAEYTRIAEKAGWPKPQKLTDERKRKLKLRLEEAGGLQGWIAAIERAARSPLMRGENDRGWRASIDFFLKPSSFLRLIEGNYDDKRRNSGSVIPRTPQDQEKGWANQLTLWKRGSWNGYWGPEPLQPECIIPPEFVKRWEASVLPLAQSCPPPIPESRTL
ncbi:hypothetical protein [Labrys sp. ZIDIC5]|uniref:hypothetical protein n=1 Tax=Labrys sedimenti TaxID=3106036 RepID=UPI002ACAB4BC|nr:hypothetical protein [Labrys sp. ZIDIC5]MDZ5448616.1 hypothetical protein [Labrys sp. ZIDIC5]